MKNSSTDLTVPIRAVPHKVVAQDSIPVLVLVTKSASITLLAQIVKGLHHRIYVPHIKVN